ncbi:hypothetical protein V494_00966 [Pseudogymnoascus sp. VKM F-4513 (FW-928)]|nr:hypothetical protein V494_00966 [Pseudogymnoascus sp. VKM F-4513 (FW-928)]
MSGNRTRKEDMWAKSSASSTNENRTPTSPPKSTPATSPAKSTGGSSVATRNSTNSAKTTLTPSSITSTAHSGSHTPDTEGLPHMPNVSRVSEFADGSEFGDEASSMLAGGHQQHADALTRALSVISLHGDTTPRALKMANVTATN